MEEMGPRDRGVAGEGAEEPGRGEKAPIASGGGMRRSEEARVSEEAVRRRVAEEVPGNWEWAKGGEAEEPV